MPKQKYKFVRDISDFPRISSKPSGLSKGYIAISDGYQYMIKQADKKQESYEIQGGQALSTEVFVELAIADVFRGLLGKYAPLIYFASDESNAYLISRFIDNFSTSLSLISSSKKALKGVRGFEELLVASMLCGDSDIHAKNVGVVTNEEGERIFAKIDHGRAGNKFVTSVVIADILSSDMIAIYTQNGLKISLDTVQEEIQRLNDLEFDRVSHRIRRRVEAMRDGGVDLLNVFSSEIHPRKRKNDVSLVVSHFMSVITTNRATLLQFYRNTQFQVVYSQVLDGGSFIDMCFYMSERIKAAEYCGEFSVWFSKYGIPANIIEANHIKELAQESHEFIEGATSLQLVYREYALSLMAEANMITMAPFSRRGGFTDMHLWASSQSRAKNELFQNQNPEYINVQDDRGNTPLFYLLQNFYQKHDGTILSSYMDGFAKLKPDINIHNRAGDNALDYFLWHIRRVCRSPRDMLKYFYIVMPHFYFDQHSLTKMARIIPYNKDFATVLSCVVGYMTLVSAPHEIVDGFMSYGHQKAGANIIEFSNRVTEWIDYLGLEDKEVNSVIMGCAESETRLLVFNSINTGLGRALSISRKLHRCRECFKDDLMQYLPNVSVIMLGYREPGLVNDSLEFIFHKINASSTVSKSDETLHKTWSSIVKDSMHIIDKYLDLHHDKRHPERS